MITRSWQFDPTMDIRPTPAPCSPEAEIPRLDGEGQVPHLMPGKNPFVNEVTTRYHIPIEAVMGEAETDYPEYRKKLKDTYVAPEKCFRYCCGWEGTAAAKLNCILRPGLVPPPEKK